MNGEGITKIRRQISLEERFELKKIHEESISPLGSNAYGLFQIKYGSISSETVIYRARALLTLCDHP
jgi:hypothetical protein